MLEYVKRRSETDKGRPIIYASQKHGLAPETKKGADEEYPVEKEIPKLDDIQYDDVMDEISDLAQKGDQKEAERYVQKPGE